MNADQAWQSVLGQLQLDMPRASFETWVRDTRPVAYDNRTLTIGVRNAYARDWLESRLASTVNRLLIGILDSNVSVSFSVSQGKDNESQSDPETFDQTSSLDHQDRPGRPVTDSTQNISPESRARNASLNPRY